MSENRDRDFTFYLTTERAGRLYVPYGVCRSDLALLRSQFDDAFKTLTTLVELDEAAHE